MPKAGVAIARMGQMPRFSGRRIAHAHCLSTFRHQATRPIRPASSLVPRDGCPLLQTRSKPTALRPKRAANLLHWPSAFQSPRLQPWPADDARETPALALSPRDPRVGESSPAKGVVRMHLTRPPSHSPVQLLRQKAERLSELQWAARKWGGQTQSFLADQKPMVKEGLAEACPGNPGAEIKVEFESESPYGFDCKWSKRMSEVGTLQLRIFNFGAGSGIYAAAVDPGSRCSICDETRTRPSLNAPC